MLTIPPSDGTRMLPAKALQGTRVLVTGGGTGVGRAIAVEFGRCGAHVVVASRDGHHRNAGVEAVRSVGGTAEEVEIDLLDVDSITAAFDAAGELDILINNAAANFFAPSEEVSERGWTTIADRVLKGAFFCSTAFARQAIPRGRGGAILNIVSTPGIDGGPGVAVSAAAKAGVINLTKTMAIEYAGDGIRVNALSPGLFPHQDDSPLVSAGRVQFSDEAMATVPIGRVGELRELGWLATYMCSPFAAYLTGQLIVLDGGIRLPSQLIRAPFTPIREQVPRRSPATPQPAAETEAAQKGTPQ